MVATVDGIAEGADGTGEDVMGEGVSLDGSIEGADVNGEGNREGGMLRPSVGLLEGLDGSIEGADVNDEGNREGRLLRLSVALLEDLELDGVEGGDDGAKSSLDGSDDRP